MAPLPASRVNLMKYCFESVGVDLFGPMMVRRGRCTIKRYGAIFTCMASRAVHLEMAYSLDTSSCIHALRRFISRRGQVAHIRSDNGTNFVGAEQELTQFRQNPYSMFPTSYRHPDPIYCLIISFPCPNQVVCSHIVQTHNERVCWKTVRSSC